MARLPRCEPLLDALVRNSFASIERGERSHDSRDLPFVVAEHDPAAAKRVAFHILYCVETLLLENPQLGNPGRVPGTRELVIPKTPYIVPYRIRRMKIEIARVYHSSRRWPERL
jgi:toxin ParE1/3/4